MQPPNFSNTESDDAADPVVPPWVTMSGISEPSAQGAARLRDALATTMAGGSDTVERTTLGNYSLLEMLGEGGMGRVYRARDEATGDIVAIKVLNERLVGQKDALQRFKKEARMLAEVDSPYVTRMIDVCEDDGVHFLVVEFVNGRSLADFVEERGRLNEMSALTIIASVARALAAMHPNGIIHRDIKPENILLELEDAEPKVRRDSDPVENAATGSESHRTTGATGSELRRTVTPQPLDFISVKLTDFGLARQMTQTQSMAMTGAHTLLGTPNYMSPEQFSGAANVDTRSDIYSLGATLFHLLAGQPPFVTDDVLKLAEMHRHTAAPSLRSVNCDASDGVSAIVAKALEKQPELRYADANRMLDDLLHLLKGEATSVAVHPLLPATQQQHRLRFSFSWDLLSAPEDLWPFVSHTERLNRAIGLPAVEYTTTIGEHNQVQRWADVRISGLKLRWQEHPFEWIEGRRMGVLREFESGPLSWFTSVVELTGRASGGTTLTHSFDVEPRSRFGRLFAHLQIAVLSRRSLEKTYRRIDSVLNRPVHADALIDPFEAPTSPAFAQRRRLDRVVDQLSSRRLQPAVLLQMAEFIRTAPAQEVARIRPLVLAERMNQSADDVTAVCLHGVRDGMFELLWDIICPVCRISSGTIDTMAELLAHHHCEACNIAFEVDFAKCVELIFRAHPQIRNSVTGKFCIGGPGHSPHVVAQIRAAGGETVELGLSLREGDYIVRGPQLPFRLSVRVRAAEAPSRLHLDLRRKADWMQPGSLQEGTQVLSLANTFDHELIVRVERVALKDDGLTAAQALAIPLFQELFPTEVLSPEHLTNVAQMTFLTTASGEEDAFVERFGEATAYRLLQDHFRRLGNLAKSSGGVWVKTVGSGCMIAFTDASAAVQVALSLSESIPDIDGHPAWQPRAAVHGGSAFITSVSGRTEYFGEVVRTAMKLPESAEPGEVMISDEVMSDGDVRSLLEAELPRAGTLHRVRVT